MTELLRKNIIFGWSDECQQSMDELKERLTMAPILILPNNESDFVIYSDASWNGLGCVLMQNGRIISYISRQLKPHKKKYPIHDLELTVVVLALKIWRHYLYRSKFLIFTDNKSLKYIMTQKKLNLQQRR